MVWPRCRTCRLRDRNATSNAPPGPKISYRLAYRKTHRDRLHPRRHSLHRVAPYLRSDGELAVAQALTSQALTITQCIILHRFAAREWMGIEPTKRRASDASTALKAAGPTRRPDTPSGRCVDCITPGSGINTMISQSGEMVATLTLTVTATPGVRATRVLDRLPADSVTGAGPQPGTWMPDAGSPIGVTRVRVLECTLWYVARMPFAGKRWSLAPILT